MSTRSEQEPSLDRPVEGRAKPRLLTSPDSRPRAAEHDFDLLRARALAVLARGSAHRLSNVLALFSSHAQLLDAGIREGAPRRDARALHDGVARGTRVVDLLDHLARPIALDAAGLPIFPIGVPVCVGSVVRSLGDVLLCENDERRLPIEVRTQPLVQADVAPGVLVTVLILLVDQLVTSAPLALPGSVLLEVSTEAKSRRPCIRIEFRIGADHLPFRLPPATIAPALADLATAAGIDIEADPDRPAFDVRPTGAPRAARGEGSLEVESGPESGHSATP